MEPPQPRPTNENKPRSNLQNDLATMSCSLQKNRNNGSPAAGFNCSTGGCDCNLCVSQCSAKGGNLSLDGSTLSTSSSDCTCPDASTSSIETSEDSSTSCCSHNDILLPNDVPRETVSADAHTQWKLIPLTMSQNEGQLKDSSVEKQSLEFESKENEGSAECSTHKTEDENRTAPGTKYDGLDKIKIVSTWTIDTTRNEGQPLEIDEDDYKINMELQQEGSGSMPKNIPLEESRDIKNIDPRLNKEIKRQVAEIKPQTAKSYPAETPEGGTLQQQANPNLMKEQGGDGPPEDSFNKQSNSRKTGRVQRGTMTSGTTMRSSNEAISVGYGPKTTVVRSDSYTENVQTIVDNVLKANLPVILLAGVAGSPQETSKKETTDSAMSDQKMGTSIQTLRELKERVKRTSDAGTSMVSDDSRNKGTQTLSKEDDTIRSTQSPSSSISDSSYNKAPSSSQLRHSECDHQDKDMLVNAQLQSMVKYMVKHLPYYIRSDLFDRTKSTKFVLTSDVEEVIFPSHETGLKSGNEFWDPSDENLCCCNHISQHSFAYQCQKVQQGELLIAAESLTSGRFLELVKNLKDSESPLSPDASPDKAKPIPLLGEVRYGKHSFAMIYRYEQEAQKTMVFVPAADLVAHFPSSAPKLRQLAFQNGPIQVAFDVRFRTATKEEARCLMRYKAATGRLDPNDEKWRYLTSRSLLVHWYDFRKAFLCDTTNISQEKVKNEIYENHSSVSPPTVCETKRPQTAKRSPPGHKKGKKRKRSFTKVAKIKSCQNMKQRVKTPSPKMRRTSTPVTSVDGCQKSNEKRGGKKRSPIIPFVRKPVQPLGKSSMDESESQVSKGLWKLQQEIIKLREEQEKKKNTKKDRKCSTPIKSEEGGKEHPTGKGGCTVLKKELEDAVNSNPFTQSIEKLKMVKTLNAAIMSGKNNLPKCKPGEKYIAKSMTKETENSQDEKIEAIGNNSRVTHEKTVTKEKKIPVPIKSAHSPSVEKIKVYLKKAPQVVRNPIYLDSSAGNFSEQNSRNSEALSLVSDDSIVNFLNGQNDKENDTKQENIKLTLQTEGHKMHQKTARKPKKKKSHKGTGRRKDTEGTTPTPTKKYSDNPIEEAQRRILEIIKKQHREKMDFAKLKQASVVTNDNGSKENKDVKEATSQLHEKADSDTPTFSWRVFPRKELCGGQSKSGLVVIETETQSTLPYVANNGFPYTALTYTRTLFPGCLCKIYSTVLKNSRLLKRKVLMCSYEEAQMLHEEGQSLSLKVPNVTSGDWIVRVDELVKLLSELREEVREAHKRKNSKRCYIRDVNSN